MFSDLRNVQKCATKSATSIYCLLETVTLCIYLQASTTAASFLNITNCKSALNLENKVVKNWSLELIYPTSSQKVTYFDTIINGDQSNPKYLPDW